MLGFFHGRTREDRPFTIELKPGRMEYAYEVGWTIEELAAGNYRGVHGINVRLDLIEILSLYEKYCEFFRSNPHLLTSSGKRFIDALLPAVAQMKSTIEKI
jgi:hypothetical protein